MKENEVQLKICGFQKLEPAVVAAQEGADYLGFVFVPGHPYEISLKDAKNIVGVLTQFPVRIVGIFQDAPIDRVNDIVKDVGLKYVQLHGEEPPDYCQEVEGARVIKAFGITSDVRAIDLLNRFGQYDVDLYVLDRMQHGVGPRVPLNVAREAARQFPFFLAGGITPENALEIINHVSPFGIDVASGVDTEGKKDIAKIRSLIHTVKGVGSGGKVSYE